MIPIKRTCRFLLDKEKGNDTARIRYTIRWCGNVVKFLVGYRVDVSKWSTSSQRCKPNTTHGDDRIPASDINKRIDIFEENLNDIFYKYEVAEKTPTDDELRDDFNFMIHGGGENASLITYYKEFIEYSNKVKSVTKNRYLSLKQTGKILFKYKPKLRLNNVNKEELNNFIEFLFKESYLNSTVQKHYSNLRTFLIWAKDKRYYGGDALEVRRKFNEVRDKDIIYLDWEELRKMMDVDLAKDNDNLIRDMFIFSCFTGLRYSDVIKLKKEDVTKDYIEVVTKKTRHHLKIDINDYSRAIIDKYKDGPLPTFFYPFNISFVNKKLKAIAKNAGLDTKVNVTKISKNKVDQISVHKYKVISSHCGRRTFVVSALRANIPVEVIMKWTGHSSFESMKPYIAIVDELKVKEMDKFNKICFRFEAG